MKYTRFIAVFISALLLCSCGKNGASDLVETSAPESVVSEDVIDTEAVTEATTNEAAVATETIADTVTTTDTSETTSPKIDATETTAKAVDSTETTATTPLTAENEPISPVMEQYNEIADRIDELFAEICEDREHPVVHILTYNGDKIDSKEIYTKLFRIL